MRRIAFFVAFFVFQINVSAQKTVDTTKPWAYWWWLGSSVSKAGISQNLHDYAEAGFGGLHIIPIYGVKNNQQNNLLFLSNEWLAMLDHTLKEAQRLGLGIDLSLGTGWPYGGSHVSADDAAKSFQVIEKDSVFRLETSLTNQKVKRAAPGGEGLVLDHFSKTAVEHYLMHFDTIFKSGKYPIRAFYNDSYEVYGANWTTDFLSEFKTRRGYDLADYLPVLSKKEAETDTEKRIWGDYNATISELLLDNFTKPWATWIHDLGKISRNEAHGSPANILDLYAAADIPETEYFGSKSFDIPYHRLDPDYEKSRFGTPSPLILKFASSAAHLTGKRLVSSETATWLGNHFKVSLSQIKPIIDESFAAGVNHVFYHGIPYSPPNAPYPGWLFYASTNFNQQSHFWKELPLLNGYVARCQAVLQNSTPDNDVLLYFPIHDLWHSAGGKQHIKLLDVHANAKDWLFDTPFGKTAQQLQDWGVGFDYVSDLQLGRMPYEPTLKMLKQQTIIVPPCEYLPLQTLRILDNFRKKGVPIYFIDKLPQKVNGFNDWQGRQQQFEQIIGSFAVIDSDKLKEKLQPKSEPMTDLGLTFIRKKNKFGTLYFIVNQHQQFNSGTVQLNAKAKAVQVFDPLHQRKEFVDFRKTKNNLIEFSLNLKSGESVFVQTFDELQSKKNISNLIDYQTDTLKNNWSVTFVEGQPFLPKSYKTNNLQSWTNSTDSATQYFSGTARYSTVFNSKTVHKVQNFMNGSTIWLDLGNVRETAKVWLNGQYVGTAWCLPFRLPIDPKLLKSVNKLDIEVTNLSANRMRYLDKIGTKWKNFEDINIVDIQYKPFDASKWIPETSGLLGPVTISK